MCGELDEDIHINAEIRDRIMAISRKAGVAAPAAQRDPGPLAEGEERSAYMEQLFRAALAETLADVNGAAEDQKIDVIASRAIAFARLAGFLAGHLPPEADLFRGVIEAVTDGHSEPRRIAERLRTELDHHHHHHHGDDHHHHDHGSHQQSDSHGHHKHGHAHAHD